MLSRKWASSLVMLAAFGIGASDEPRRDPMLGRAWSVLHPRVAGAARQLREAQDAAEATAAARVLLRIDSEAARDVVADYAAGSALRAFDRVHRVLMILDATDGSIRNVIGAEERKKDREKKPTIVSCKIGDPPVLWSAVRRLPDGAVAADEGGGEGSVSFILKAKDPATYYLHIVTFRGERLDWDRCVYRDVTKAQLRRWQASDWWPKDWH